MNTTRHAQRYKLLDTLRGWTLLHMIAYHASWDYVYLYGGNWQWYHGIGAYVWQQSICWSFILLSGFCWNLGKHHVRSGLKVLIGGMLVTLVTVLFVWEDRVIFGVLTMLGSSMLLMIPIHSLLPRRMRLPWLGLLCSIALFVLTRNINTGWLGFEAWNWIALDHCPWLYRGYLATYLGFCDPGFFSTDYFSIIPWFFLFLTGYFLYRTLPMENRRIQSGLTHGIQPLAFLGKHSLLIYLLHQPVLYALFELWYRLFPVIVS